MRYNTNKPLHYREQIITNLYNLSFQFQKCQLTYWTNEAKKKYMYSDIR